MSPMQGWSIVHMNFHFLYRYKTMDYYQFAIYSKTNLDYRNKHIQINKEN